MAASCPWCNAPRGEGPSCPRCGANYAKAEQIRAHGRAAAVAPSLEPVSSAPAPVAVAVEPAIAEPPLVDDPALEFKFCIAAIPVALVLGVLFHLFLPFLQRTFLAMPVHEVGHAAAAWFTGHWAIPTLWKTPTGEARDFVTPLVLAGLIGFMMFRAHRDGNRGLVALGAALLALQAIGTLFISSKNAQMLIVWGGDGVGMVLAVALMATFFFGKRTQLYKGSLRWGFVCIGAAAFVDMFARWVAARRDHGKIPFGEQEGVGLSDATRLVDEFGWSTGELTGRYVATGIACLVALGAVYAWGVLAAKRASPRRTTSHERPLQ